MFETQRSNQQITSIAHLMCRSTDFVDSRSVCKVNKADTILHSGVCCSGFLLKMKSNLGKISRAVFSFEFKATCKNSVMHF